MKLRAAFALALAWLCLEYVALGPSSYFRIQDNADSIVPALLTQASTLFEPALWFPYAGAGADRLALGFFSGIDTALFALLPGWLAYQVLVISHFLLATTFTYLLARRVLTLDGLSAALAGLYFGMSTVLGQLYIAPVAYFPFVLWALSQALDSRSAARRWIIVAGLAALYSLTAHPQVLFPFAFVLIFAWFWLIERRRQGRAYVLLGVFTLLCIALRIQDIAAMAANGPLSHRFDWAAGLEAVDVPRRAFIHLGGFHQDPATKVMVLVLLLGGLVRAVRTPHYLAMLGLALLVALAPIAFELLAFALREALPFLAKFSFQRFHFYLHLPVALGAALVLARMPHDLGIARRLRALTRTASDRRLAVALVVLVLAGQTLLVKAEHLGQWLNGASYKAQLDNPLADTLARGVHPSDRPFRVASFRRMPALLQAQGLETVDGYLTLYPRRYKEFWERVIAPYMSGDPLIENWMVNWGSEFYLFHRRDEPRIAFRETYNLALLSLANTRFILSGDVLVDEALVPLVEAERPVSALSAAERRRVNVAANFAGWTQTYIYENTNAFPRFFLTKDVVELDDGNAVLDAIAAAPEATLRRTAFVERGAIGRDAARGVGFSEGTVTLTAYGPDRIALDVAVDGRAVLVGSNAYTPYWRCRVGGVDVPIFPVDHAFWGVTIEPGEHRVTFRYDPPHRLF